ncbi:hypothetical protein [Methylocapsa aurea]|uniref:hypothetical protein n=1 Tax=Methylocapsa aurea TaxID=663610 RepID=UPI000A6106F5|nr:hypothetical protein [Methylocapsa aurea]
MLPEIFGLVVWLASGVPTTSQIDSDLRALSQPLAALRQISFLSLPAKAAFRPAERAVTNWRIEAAGNLDLPPQSMAKVVAGADASGVPRCVKLNNYWCIKRAGWAGEIAADAEGHVAFASAIEGAIVAAVLLRRYYLIYNRRTAQAILSRWAPAQCGSPASAIRPSPKSRPISIGQRALAPRGIGNTLRARWLAAHRPGFTGGGKAAPPRSIVADRPIALLRAPEIAVGMGEDGRDRAPMKLAALDLALPMASVGGGAPCPDESQRIHNYALRAIQGIASSPDEDLHLFSPDGTPGPNLPRLMQNMAKVEIGPLAAGSELIAAAVEAEMRRNQAAAALAGPAPSAQ